LPSRVREICENALRYGIEFDRFQFVMRNVAYNTEIGRKVHSALVDPRDRARRLISIS
jgi:hypothetical protein